MKRLFSLILAICILASVFVIPVSALSDDIQIISGDSFNDYPTYGLSSRASVEGAPMVVVTKDNKDKALELSGKSGSNGVYYEAAPDGDDVTFWAEIKNSESYSRFTIYLKDSSGKVFNLIKLGEDGKLSTSEPRVAYGFARGRFTPVQLTYNAKHKRLSLYVNGKKVFYERYAGASAPTSVAGFGIKCDGKKDASVLVDNIAIYEGKKVYKDNSFIPKASFNPEIVENTGAQDGTDPIVGNTVFLNRTFDEDNMSYVDGYDNLTANITHETSLIDGNKYIKLQKNTSSQAMLQMRTSSEAKNVVVDVKLSLDPEEDTTSGILIYGREERSGVVTFTPYVRIYSGGRIALADGTTLAILQKYKWTNLVFVADYNARNFDVYIDGELKAENVLITNSAVQGLPVLRMGFEAHSIMGALLIDDIKLYEGTEPRVIEGAVRRNVLAPDTQAPGYLGTMRAVGLHSDAIYNGSKKLFTSSPVIREADGKTYMTEIDIKALLGEKAAPKAAHPSKADYFDVDKAAADLGMNRFEYETRVVIYSNSVIDLDEAKLDKIHKYLLFDRPSAEDVQAKYVATASSHPRIIINKDDLEKIKSLYKTDSYMKKWGDRAIAEANKAFGTPEFKYELLVSEMKDVDVALPMIMNLSMAYHLTGNTRYVARAWKMLENICLLDDWNPQSYLDVGELTAICAIGYDWLFDVLTEEQKTFIAQTMYKRGVERTYRIYFNQVPSTEAYTTWWDAKNNWNAVCNGGSMIGAMAIYERYPEVCADLIRNATRGLEYMMPTYYPYGTWEEGAGYWRYALQYVVYTITSFENTFGDDFGFLNTPGLDNTGWFGTALAGSTGMNNFGDAAGGFTNNPQVMWCAVQFNDPVLMAARLQEIENLHGGSVMDMLYYDPSLASGEANLSLDSRAEGMEAVSLRERWYDKSATYLGFSGGKAIRNHGHMDMGHFVVDMAGERFLIDAGAENYNMPGYFNGMLRYRYYRARPEGHNTYVINPTNAEDDYGINIKAFAKSSPVVSKPRGAYATMDLTDAYERDATSAIRGYMLTDDRRSVVVRDEIELKGESTIHWFLHTKAEIEMADKNTAILTLNGKKVKVAITTNAKDYTFGETKAASLPTSPQLPQSDNASVNMRKLTLTAKANGRLTITVKVSQLDDPGSLTPPPDINIADWTIPDGEVTPLPVADMIYADGKEIEDFDPKIIGYSTLCPNSQKTVPQITASSSQRVEVIQAKEFGEDTIVKVFDNINPDVYRVYRVNFYKLPPLADVNGMKRFGVAEVTASHEPEAQNPATNVIDQNFGTRWAADGKGVWVQLELDDTYKVDCIGVSFRDGGARVTPYILELSLDGENWTEVYNGNSMGINSEYEFRDVPGIKAKYARLTCFGNNITTWNSITEFAVLGK